MAMHLLEHSTTQRRHLEQTYEWSDT